MLTARNVLKNFLSLTFADFFNKALAFFGVAYLARVLGVEGFGRIEFAQAITVYFFLLVNQGLSTYGVREIAKDKSDIKTYVNHIITMRIFLSTISYVLLVVFAICINQPPEIKKLLLIYGLGLFTFSLTLDWIFQGIERMEYMALGRIANQAVYVGGLFLLVKNPDQFLRVPLAKVAAAMTGAAILLYIFIKRYGGIRLRYDPNLWKQILRQSVPMGISFILIRIYYTFDAVMLGFMKGEMVVGWYNAAYKIVLLFTSFAGLFGTVIFPVLSRYYKESPTQLRGFMLKSSRLTIFLGLPIAVGGTILSHQIIQLVYGPPYYASILPLQILIWSVFTVYFYCSFAFCLLACDKQKEYMYSVLAGAIINLILNFALIPKYSMLGASIATIAGEVVVLGLILFYSARIIKAVPWIDLVKVLSASAFMGMVLYFAPFNFWLRVLAGILVYVSCLSAIKGIRSEDIRSFKEMLRPSYGRK